MDANGIGPPKQLAKLTVNARVDEQYGSALGSATIFKNPPLKKKQPAQPKQSPLEWPRTATTRSVVSDSDEPVSLCCLPFSAQHWEFFFKYRWQTSQEIAII